MRIKLFPLVFFLALLFLALFPKNTLASDGMTELRSVTGKGYRCVAYSLLMQDNVYTILVSCEDLIYPIDPPTLNSYVLWATPKAAGDPVRIGELGLGKITTRIDKPFSSLFVTTELNGGVRSPSGNVVMRGSLKPATFLEILTTITPTPEGMQTQENQAPETTALSTREKLFLALRRAGIAALFALVALVGLVFVITRSRG